ncbi:MAG: CHAP domain-containing protein [Oscillospiraceae bacterium]|nr:CHAP domain-containing protein [Oscillospiraceae bacterium]
MGKIKTREKVRDIKVLDKAAIAGQQMKNAAIRAKEQAAKIGNERQESLNEYAGERVQEAAEAVRQKAVRVVAAGGRTVVRGGKAVIRRRDSPADVKAVPDAVPDSAVQWNELLPSMGCTADLPQGAGPAPWNAGDMDRAGRSTAPPRQGRNSIDRVLPETGQPAYPAADSVERGRALAKRQAAERTLAVRRTADKPPVPPLYAERLPLPVEQPRGTVSPPVSWDRRTAPRQRQDKTGDLPASKTRRPKNWQRSAPQRRTSLRHTRAEPPFGPASRAHGTAPIVPPMRQAEMVRAKAKSTAKAAKAAGEVAKKTARAAAAAARSLTAALAAGGGTVLLVLVMILLPGLLLGSCFGIFFSGHDSGTGQTMPEVIREINQEFEDKLEAIQNETPHDDVEISVSQARWPEVLAVYAVKTTTDPARAQDVATVTSEKKDLLRTIFWTMHAVSSYTTSSSHTVTSTVPTEGGGSEEVSEAVTVTTLHIVITHRSVDEMANEYGFSTDQRQQLHELLSEENRRLWTALLSGLGPGDDTIVAVALSQLGNRGGEPYWSWYGFDCRVNWCACFVSWCADQCGYLDADVLPKFSYCTAGIQWFQDAGLWQDRTFEPRPGDLIFFDWEADGVSDHVGIVEKTENGTIYTVEGNCNDACKQSAYALGSEVIFGFGTPNYDLEGTE